MNKVFLILAALVLSLSAAGQKRIAHGKVVHSLNMAPLEGAWVGIPDSSIHTFTDSLGEFEIFVPEGFHKLEVRKEEYESVTYTLKPGFWLQDITIVLQKQMDVARENYFAAKSYFTKVRMMDGRTFRGTLLKCNDTVLSLVLSPQAAGQYQRTQRFRLDAIESVDLNPRYNATGMAIAVPAGLLGGLVVGWLVRLIGILATLAFDDPFPDAPWQGALIGAASGLAIGITIDVARHSSHQKYHFQIQGRPQDIPEEMEILKLYSPSRTRR